MDTSMPDSLNLPRQLANLDTVPQAVSDNAVVQLLGAAFGRAPLGPEGLRDTKLAAFLLDVDSGRYADHRLGKPVRIGTAPLVLERLAAIGGMSVSRARIAVARLTEAGVLEVVADSVAGTLQFSAASLCPAGAFQFVDWIAVLGMLAGRAPALSVLRASIDLMRMPWEWTRLTYEMLARHACYSIGMAQRGIAQLLAAGVMERSTHAGRGHDYRLMPWALGRGPRAQSPVAAAPAFDRERHVEAVTSQSDVLPTSLEVRSRVKADVGSMVVELGGLVVRMPAGTEIRMTVGADGVPVYELGPDLRITRRV